MKRLVRLLFIYSKGVFFIPHLILYMFIKSKHTVKEDVAMYKKKRKVRMGNFLLFLYLLEEDAYFRKMFYCRVGKWSRLISWYVPGAKTFFPIANIGGGIYLPHPYATILNAKSIGRNFTCRQCTTIGNKIDGRNDLVPTIGHNVTLGANVCIIGNIRIGNNVIVGSGSVVVKDVPDNCVVAGNPAIVIKSLDIERVYE